MWTNRVLMCGIDILLCLWAVYLFFFYFDIFFARKRKRYLSVIGITLFVIWQFGITTIISFPAYINIAVTIMFTFSILAYAENKEYEKMTGFIEEIMGEGGMVIASISNSGNIVIDSLIGYWYVTAQNKRIIFKTDICIPMIMPFKGADLSLILGNLLENAVEAAEKVEENRYINVKMKFDKNNLLLFVDNSYKGKLLKTRDNRLKSTKSDAENHGVGLASVYRAVAKYHGSVVIEDSEPGKFKIRIVLYSNVQE